MLPPLLMSRYLSSCLAACHLARCCCPAGCRWNWRGRSPRAQRRCGWRRKRPSRRTPSPGAASSPDRRRMHSPPRGSVAPPAGADTKYMSQTLLHPSLHLKASYVSMLRKDLCKFKRSSKSNAAIFRGFGGCTSKISHSFLNPNTPCKLPQRILGSQLKWHVLTNESKNDHFT